MGEHSRALADHAAAMRDGGQAMAAEGEATRREGRAMAADRMGPEGMGPGMDTLPLPERLEHMQQMMQRHEAMMNERLARVIGATRSLYAVLSPEQRRILDHMPMEMLHGGDMGHMDHIGHGGRPPMGGPGAPPPPPQG